jgi:iron complex transport system permease protein
MTKREAAILAVLAVGVTGVFLLSLALGSTSIPLRRVVMALLDSSAGADSSAMVVTAVRLPRSVTAMLAGAALGIAGLQMQTLFRNPLADPFALGISSGASLGVALVVLGSGYGPATAFGTAMGMRGDALITVAAIVGAALVLGLVLAVSSHIANPTTVLILGLMFGYAVSSVVTVLVGASQPERLQQWAQWGFGSFSGVTWPRLRLFGPLRRGVLVASGATTKQLNAPCSRELRAMMGCGESARVLSMLGASILGAVVTAFCGPISFLESPCRTCRGLLGSRIIESWCLRSWLDGSCGRLVAQIVSLLPGSAGVLPLNAVTSLMGAPVVVAVLLRSRRGALAG